MRKIALLAAIALAAVPAALAADNPSPSTQASTLCKQQRAALGTKAFTLLYGGSANAFGRCVSKVAGTVENTNTNAAKQCAAERADTSFPDSHDGKTFNEYYGTGQHGNNAFGKCVSSKAQTLEQDQQDSTINAAKTCKAERSQLGADAFTKKYGGRSNAFGKCVAKAKQATH